MQFKVILLSALMALLGFACTATAATIPTTLQTSTPIDSFCTPSVNETTCILGWLTGGPGLCDGPCTIGEVNLYSPHCKFWNGAELWSDVLNHAIGIGTPQLSVFELVVFLPVYSDGWLQPEYWFGNVKYGASDCDCMDDPAEGGAAHVCICRFTCTPNDADDLAVDGNTDG